MKNNSGLFHEEFEAYIPTSHSENWMGIKMTPKVPS